MNRKIPALLILCLALGVPLSMQAQSSSKIPADLAARAADGPVRVLVQLTAGTTPETALDAAGVQRQRAAIATAQTTVLDTLPYADAVIRFETIAGFAVTTDAEGLARLATNSNVASVAADRVYIVSDAQAAVANADMRSGELTVTPNLLRADRLWANGTHGVTWNVAVVGYGVEKTHSFFPNRVTSEACYSTTSSSGVLFPGTSSTSLCPEGSSSSTAVNSALPCPDPQCERSTMVAGIALGSNNLLSGMAPRAGLIAIKVFTRFTGLACGTDPSSVCLGATESDVARGLDRVAALSASLKVASVHFAGVPTNIAPAAGSCDAGNPTFKASVDNLRAIGIPTVMGSGENASTVGMAAPACVSSVVTVGATSKSPEAFQPFSNRPAFLKLLAPGLHIMTSSLSDTYGEFSNTDLAAAHVAGAWALLKTIFPGVSVDAALDAFQRTGILFVDTQTGRYFPRIVIDKAAGSLGPGGSPTEVVATAVGNNVTITWANPFDGSVPATFHVEFASFENGGNVLGVINAGSTRSFVTTLPNGRYLVRVRAVNGAGVRGAASNDVRLQVGLPPISEPPLPPSGFRAELDRQTVSLFWNLPTESAPASSYEIEASSIPNFSTNLGTFDTNSSAQTIIFRNVQPGTYFARVRARNAFGASGPSNEIAVTVAGSGCGFVGPPTGLNATVVNGLVTLNWNPPVLPGAIVGYIIEAGTAPGASNVVVASIGNQTAVAANNVAAGTSYIASAGTERQLRNYWPVIRGNSRRTIALLLFLTLIACLAGLVGLYVRLRREFPQGITFLTLALVVGATPLAWYTFFEPSVIDVTAFAVVAWATTLAGDGRSKDQPPPTSPNGDDRPLRATILVISASAIVSLTVAWFALGAGTALHLANTRLVDVLFSSWNGFLSWTPAVYIAVIGTIAYIRRDRVWGVGALLVLLLTAALIGATDRWADVRTFGAQSMIAVLALLAPGLAYAIDSVRKRPLLAMAPLVVLPVVWNHLLMVQYTVGMLPKDEPVSFARMVRQQADGSARSWRTYPFAFPANVWFAWREGLPVDRYDTLALEPRAESLDLVMDRAAGRFLLEGWDGITSEGEAPGWWIGGRTATIAVPLSLPANRSVRIVVSGRSRHEEPVVEADLALMVNGQEVGHFSPSADLASDAQFVVTRAFFRDGFNRFSFVSRGNHRRDANDTRPPGPIARRAGRPVWPVAVYRIVITPQ